MRNKSPRLHYHHTFRNGTKTSRRLSKPRHRLHHSHQHQVCRKRYRSSITMLSVVILLVPSMWRQVKAKVPPLLPTRILPAVLSPKTRFSARWALLNLITVQDFHQLHQKRNNFNPKKIFKLKSRIGLI